MAKNLGKSIKYLTFAEDYKPKTSMKNCQMLSKTEVKKMCNVLLISVLHIIEGGVNLQDLDSGFPKIILLAIICPLRLHRVDFCMLTLIDPIP
jgi:hypothetical protein